MSRFLFLPIVALLLSTATAAQARNAVVGTWEIVSAKANLNGTSRNLFGPRRSGQLVFTKEMRFAVVINDPGVPRFASEDRAQGPAHLLVGSTAVERVRARLDEWRREIARWIYRRRQEARGDDVRTVNG